MFRKGLAGSTCRDLPFPPSGGSRTTLIPPACLPGYRQLCQDCWEDDPAQRPSAQQVLERMQQCVAQQRQPPQYGVALPAMPTARRMSTEDASSVVARHGGQHGATPGSQEACGFGVDGGAQGVPRGSPTAKPGSFSRTSSFCSYDGVMGLPMDERVRLISREGIPRYKSMDLA